MARVQRSVARFDLYGDAAGALPVDFVHVETLRARSEPAGWTIDAHTHGALAQVVLVSGGTMGVTLDDRSTVVPTPAAATIPPGAVHGFDLTPGADGYVISLADALLDANPMGAWMRSVLFESGVHVRLDPASADRLFALGAQLLAEHDDDAPGRQVVTTALLHALLVVLARLADAAGEHDRRPPHLYREFRALVEERYAEHWPLAVFADRLGVSERTLQRVCHRVAGVSAFEIVQERIELEARRRLTYTGVSVQQLATELGFVDPSYFARFFRRRTGLTPAAYRAA